MPRIKASDTLEGYRHDAIRAAKELLYSDRTIIKLKAAKSEIEIGSIMKGARNGKK